MAKATDIFALSLNQIANMIKSGGNKRTVLVQGHMGTGKSSLHKALFADMPSHTKR
jgi:predicted AAA+ superfamily ATPase